MAGMGTAVSGLIEPCMLPRLWTMWHTSEVDGDDHAIADEVMAAGCAEENPAPITAVCGDLVLLTLLEAPPGPRCPRCVAVLTAHATVRDIAFREERRPCHSAGLTWLRDVSDFHPIQWFRKRLPWSRSQTGQPSQVLNARAAESLVPAQRNQSKTPVVAESWPLNATAGPIPTPDAPRGAPGVASSSTAVELNSGSRLAVPTRSAGRARHARGRDGHQLLVPSLAGSRDDQVPKALEVPVRVHVQGPPATAAGAATPDAASAVPNTPADPR